MVRSCVSFHSCFYLFWVYILCCCWCGALWSIFAHAKQKSHINVVISKKKLFKILQIVWKIPLSHHSKWRESCNANNIDKWDQTKETAPKILWLRSIIIYSFLRLLIIKKRWNKRSFWIRCISIVKIYWKLIFFSINNTIDSSAVEVHASFFYSLYFYFELLE